MNDIEIHGLRQNNLKNIDLNIRKEKITVFTGVSGSGKSSIVFDTVAAEAQRQMNETYPAFLRSRLPKHLKPDVDLIRNLTPAVVVDQSALGGNARSTVGTSSELYGLLRLLFSRIGEPYGGTASDFSFNSPGGMCPVCSGLGWVISIDMDSMLDRSKSWNEGCISDGLFDPGKYFWRQFRDSGLFDPDKPIRDMEPAEYNRLMYGSSVVGGPPEHPKVEGVITKYRRLYLNRDLSQMSRAMQRRSKKIVSETRCPACHGQVVFQGAWQDLLKADTLTGQTMKGSFGIKDKPGKRSGSLPVRGADTNNLKHVDVDFPLGIMTVVTGVAGSGKSSLVTQCFARQYADQVILVDQGPITATSRSTPASFLGFYDRIRKLFADENHVSVSLFSYNSDGACPVCHGKGEILTELAYMDPVVSTCEACGGKRFSDESLSYRLGGKSTLDVLGFTVDEALEFFSDRKIRTALGHMKDAGLSYMKLGQPLSTLSGGERQRLKLAKNLGKKGTIFVLDEPTTGLHRSDVGRLIGLFDRLIARGNTVIVIEHDLDVVKRADWVIDIGPDGGHDGGEIVFEGTPQEMAEKGQTITADCLRVSL